MANQHNGSLDTREDIRNVDCIAHDAAQWVGHGHNRISVLFEDPNDPIPTRSFGKSAMHKHDGGLCRRSRTGFASRTACGSIVWADMGVESNRIARNTMWLENLLRWD